MQCQYPQNLFISMHFHFTSEFQDRGVKNRITPTLKLFWYPYKVYKANGHSIEIFPGANFELISVFQHGFDGCCKILLFVTSLLILLSFSTKIAQISECLFSLHRKFNLQQYGTNRAFLAQFVQKLWFKEGDQNSCCCAVSKSCCSGPKLLLRPNLTLHSVSSTPREAKLHVCNLRGPHQNPKLTQNTPKIDTFPLLPLKIG